jgi:3-dehydroquinate dehydratase type I
LWEAAKLGAPFIDVEYLASEAFFALGCSSLEGTKLILSNHNFESTASMEELKATEAGMRERGADIAKIAMTAQDISDAWRMITLLKERSGVLSPVADANKIFGRPQSLAVCYYRGV